MEIGKIIAGVRADADLSQQALADALFISRDLVSKWETGRRRPNYQMIEKIAAVFGVPVDRLVDKDALIFGELSEIAAECGEMSEDTLTAVIAPENATNKKVIWSSDNTTAAKVDENGKSLP